MHVLCVFVLCVVYVYAHFTYTPEQSFVISFSLNVFPLSRTLVLTYPIRLGNSKPYYRHLNRQTVLPSDTPDDGQQHRATETYVVCDTKQYIIDKRRKRQRTKKKLGKSRKCRTFFLSIFSFEK